MPSSKKLCCNYVDGNCLLLDDSEEHSCVQCISRCGIYYNYFKNAMLPVDKKLLVEIVQPNNQKALSNLQDIFHTKGKQNRMITKCAKENGFGNSHHYVDNGYTGTNLVNVR